MSFFETLTESNDFLILDETVRVFNERNIVKMDKKTLKKRLLTQATLLASKEANDPLYKKYVKHSKLKRQYRKQIQQKYQAKGRQKMREYLKAHKMLDKVE
jgi:hypothetical protein